jgi:hypothetical protein
LAGAAHPIAVAEYTFTMPRRTDAGTLPSPAELAEVVDSALALGQPDD